MELYLHSLTCAFIACTGTTTLLCPVKVGWFLYWQSVAKGTLKSSFFCVSCVFMLCLLNWLNCYYECIAHHSHSHHPVYISGCAMSVCVYHDSTYCSRVMCFLEIKVIYIYWMPVFPTCGASLPKNKNGSFTNKYICDSAGEASRK
jgi:hypothetical protein